MISNIIVNNKCYFHLVNETQFLWLIIWYEEKMIGYVLNLKMVTDYSEALLEYHFECGLLLGSRY